MDIEDDSPPPWLHLLSHVQKVWREAEISEGRNPDPTIEIRLKESGRWPEKRRLKFKKTKKAKNAKRPKRRKTTH